MGNTFDPVYNGQPRELRNWPLNTESLKILKVGYFTSDGVGVVIRSVELMI